MRVIIILFALLISTTQAIKLTYPIKGIYLGYQAANYTEPGRPIMNAANEGYNLALLTFFSNQPNDMILAWDSMINLGQKPQTYLDYAHSYGMPVLMTVWIQQQYGDVIATTNATALGIWLAGNVTSRNMDGIDIWIREYGAGYTIGSLNSSASIDWVVELATSLRRALGPDAIITFSPYAQDFGPIGDVNGAPGPLGGYTAITPRISSLIQHYNVFFFSSGAYCYIDYTSTFVSLPSSCAAGTTVQAIAANANINMSRLVVTKQISNNLIAAGYMTPDAIKTMVDTANSSLGWQGGAVGWTYNAADGGVSANWINDIYPDSNVTPIPTITSTTSTTTTLSTSTTSSPTTSSVTGLPTSVPTSPATGNPIVLDCGENKVASNGRCVCMAGYYQSGNSCKKTAVIIIAIIIPIIAIAVIVALLFVYRMRRRRTTVSRVPSRTFSNSDLENSYQSTNLITDFDSIIIKSTLGQGGSAVVNMGVWRHIDVAVKEFSNQDIQTTDFIRESELHAKLRHPNVVQLLAICLPPHMCTISEYMAKGSLADVLQNKPPSFTWKRKLQALHDIAKGMDYLHSSKIIHRDLKSQNCLIDKNWNCKIADFGTSKLVGEANQTATAYVPRTAQWSAPEVITKGEYSEQSDVYSYGVIMWECLTGQIPYDGMFAFQVEDGTVKGKRLTVPEGCDAWFEALMKECWSEDPSTRPTFGGIITCVEKSMS